MNRFCESSWSISFAFAEISGPALVLPARYKNRCVAPDMNRLYATSDIVPSLRHHNSINIRGELRCDEHCPFSSNRIRTYNVAVTEFLNSFLCYFLIGSFSCTCFWIDNNPNILKLNFVFFIETFTDCQPLVELSCIRKANNLLYTNSCFI